MRVAEWARSLLSQPQLAGFVLPEEGSTAWMSLADEARPVLLAAEYLRSPRKMIVVSASYERCLKWQAKLAMCGVPEGMIKQLPDGTSALFEDATPEHIALSDRIGALKALVDPEPCIVIGSPLAVLERTLPRDLLEEVFIDLKVGDTVDPRSLVRKLVRLGYEPAEPVRIPGQYSQRGGILDIWTTGRDLPTRIEFFGDEIESIRTFDSNSQRSTGHLSAISLAPSRETLFPEETQALREMIEQAMQMEAAQLGEAEGVRLEELVKGDLSAIENRAFFDRLDLYRPLLHPDSGCALDLLGDEGLVILDEPMELDAIASRGEEELGQALSSRAERGEILRTPAHDFVLPPDHLASTACVLSLSAMNALPDWLQPDKTEEVNAQSMEPYRGRADALSQTLKTWSDQGFCVVFCTDQPSRARSVLGQIDVFLAEAPTEKEVFEWSKGYFLANGNLGGGFVLADAKIAFVTDAELFGVARLRLPQKRFMEGAPVATVLDLQPGDYVVHIQFGIGVYRGLVKRTVEGVEKEFLYVEYAAPDKLFVPADQLDRVQKYLNPGDATPKINKLTGGEWQKTIAKAKEDAKAFAQDLVKLYAQRKMVQRRPFGPDTAWQGEMESTFPWVETPSQMIAIKETKRDLQAPYPMDRLVCGDVGFGKTEVAIRAAFKVVQDGRQVAVLCPTTILSEQHFRNFSERMESFGVRIGIINRFRTDSERKAILSELKDGKIDVLIGTHALLSKEIIFKELGLVIIDEEQKFGVKQKEVLKNLRVEVDVLSLSATPIPRTLSMALMDIRQMSLINDPPPGRLPVRTFVRPHSKEVVREAILRELARGGQVFYVYNRVQGIHHIADSLRRLVPTARIGIGHGQMNEAELEPVMIGFIKGELDILVSTSIVENGIDISNANTLIVENADRFGLSQLYQLKGRVGRSDRQAYAYFLYGSNKELTEGAFQRLQALQEFSQLGAGYSLAFRDLQIRGAGEMLGAKQSGSMTSVGYELYTQLIQEQIELLKNAVDGVPAELAADKDVVVSADPLPAFDIPATAFIPEDYIADPTQRLYYYQQMMKVRTDEQLGEVRAEIEDRYGHAPEPVANAFHVLSLRIAGQRAGMEKLEAREGRVVASMKGKHSLSPLALSYLSKMNREAFFARDQLIWPYRGEALTAVDRMMEGVESAIERASAVVAD
jgi:transcription-repair coupling factor (superfamily II helicase)